MYRTLLLTHGRRQQMRAPPAVKEFMMRAALLLAVVGLLLVPPVPASPPYQLYTVTPCRIVDTRGPGGPTGGPALVGNMTRNFPIPGNCGIPTTAKVAVLNFAVIVPTSQGHLTVWQGGTAMPLASTVNFDAGVVIANGALVQMGSDPNNAISVNLGSGLGTSAHLVIDTTGYYQ